MAGRTSTSIGVGVTVTILGVATLALFITTVIFFANKRSAERQLEEARRTTTEFVSETDRQNDAVNRAREAGKGQRPPLSAVAYLIDNQQKTMQRVTGSRSDTLDDLTKKLDAVKGAAGQNMLTLIRQRDSEIGALTQQLADANAAKEVALADRLNEVARVKGLEDSQKATLGALNDELDKYKDEVDQYREELNQAKQDMVERVARLQAAADDEIARLRTDIESLQREKVLNQSLITRLQDELKGKRVDGANEDALVDAEIIGLDAADNTAIINRGRKDKIVLGLTFSVYAEPTDIRLDPATGNYPEPKATLEVIRIDDNTATARIVRERKGNPVVRGDVVANAVYDPNKTYKFLIYGNFDTNGDGRVTFEEQSEIRARIESWGGKVQSELTGDTDFLVLGERPVLPPEPAANAPIEAINFYISLRRQAERYDQLFEKAQATSIPVLNQSRLFTLTGAQ
jgi:hypothetical protein